MGEPTMPCSARWSPQSPRTLKKPKLKTTAGGSQSVFPTGGWHQSEKLLTMQISDPTPDLLS